MATKTAAKTAYVAKLTETADMVAIVITGPAKSRLRLGITRRQKTASGAGLPAGSLRLAFAAFESILKTGKIGDNARKIVDAVNAANPTTWDAVLVIIESLV